MRCGTERAVNKLSAQIVERTRLVYAEPAADDDDRPSFVRAASGLVWFRDRLFIIQDDNQFIGVWTPGPEGALAGGRVESWTLAAGAGARRRFEEHLGNRLDKSDFEACTVVAAPEGERLLVLGSGSLPRRELALLTDPVSRPRAAPVLVPRLFAAVRAALDLAPGVMNLEGACVMNDLLWLYQRGPAPAAVAFDLAEVLAAIGGGAPGLAPRAVRRLDLGSVEGCPFGVSDVAPWTRERTVFLAVAENTANPVDDGEILGTLLGVIDGEVVSSARLLDERGAPARVKAEGVAADPSDPSHVLVALDADDPDVPAELCRVRLSGFD